MSKYNLIYDEYIGSDFDNDTDLNPKREITVGIDKDIEILAVEHEIIQKIKNKIEEYKALGSIAPKEIEQFLEKKDDSPNDEIDSPVDKTDFSYNTGSLLPISENIKEIVALTIASEDKEAEEELKKGSSNFSLCTILSLNKLLTDSLEAEKELAQIEKIQDKDEREKQKKKLKLSKKKILTEEEKKQVLSAIKQKKKAKGDLIKGDKKRRYKLCLLQDIGILQFLLIMLTVLKFVNQIISTVMTLSVPLAEYIALICGCWINPANVVEIIQKVLQQAVTGILNALIGVLIALIKELFKKCPQPLAKSLLDRLDKILGLMAGKTLKALDLLDIGSNVPKNLLEQKKKLMGSLKKEVEKQITELKSGNFLKDLGLNDLERRLITEMLEGALTPNDGVLDIDSLSDELIPASVKKLFKNKISEFEKLLSETNKEIDKIKNTKQIDKEDDLALESLSNVQRK